MAKRVVVCGVWSWFGLLVVCMVFVWAVGAVAPGVAVAEGLSSSLVVSGAPTEAEGLRAEEEARLASPEAVREREESSTAYESLSAGEAQGLAGRVFPALVREPDGGPPKLPEGQSISSFTSEFSAALSLPGGKRGVFESMSPIAVKDPASGRLVPVDVIPHQAGAGFEAMVPAAGMHVRVGGRLSEGASLGDVGVSLTPVTVGGVPLEGSGVVDGTAVFYGDSEDPAAGVLDLDSLVKIGAFAFSEESILRSERSPQRLYFRVGLPEGASLKQIGSGPVLVMEGGREIARVAVPGARDASGTVVQDVSMSVSGDVIVVSVPHQPGEYDMPLRVDPTVVDNEVENNWAFGTDNANAFESLNLTYLTAEIYYNYGGPYSAGQYGAWAYPTQGESHIYEFAATTWEQDPSSVKSLMSIASPVDGKEGEVRLPSSGSAPHTVCTGPCEPQTVTAANENDRAFLEVQATESGSAEFRTGMEGVGVYILQEKGPSVKFDTNDATLGGVTNPLYGGTWANGTAVVGVNAFDPGIGVSWVKIKSPSRPEWERRFTPGGPPLSCVGVQCNECHEDTCANGVKRAPLVFEVGQELPEGEDELEATDRNMAEMEGVATPMTVRIDRAAPYHILLSGLPASKEIGTGEYRLSAEATDGSGSTPSSGMESLTLYIDGREVGTSAASCSPGPCTARGGSWAIFGHEYATGQHTVTVVASDNAHNTSSESFTMIVHPASLLALGPGQLNPQSGEFSLRSTDVSMGGGLSVGRSYASEHLMAGSGGPLGAQWAISLGGQESLVKQPDGSMVLTDASGAQTIFAPDGKGGFVSPVGDRNLALSSVSCEEKQSEYTLTNAAAATRTCFRAPSGGSGEVFVPSVVKGPVATDTVTYAYETKEVPTGSKELVTRPTEALAPVPAGVSCSPSLKPGCRALTFNYASSTTATGEGPSEWGDTEGHLTRVYYTAYDPASKAMKTVEVAHYLYDRQARLRTEWDPRVSPALKESYGYDSEGHLTSVSLPGSQPWLIHYGTIAGDPAGGRVLAVERPKVSTPLGSTVAPVNTVVPALSSSEPKAGLRLSASTGSWSNDPLAYGYQWLRCSTTGRECEEIPGASNSSYVPLAADEDHTLAVRVTATNTQGSVSATSTMSGIVVRWYYSPEVFGSAGTSSGQFEEPHSAAPDNAGDVWVADTGNNRAQEFSIWGGYLRQIAMSKPEGVGTAHPEGVLIANTGDNKVEMYSPAGVFESELVGQGEYKLYKPPAVAQEAWNGRVYIANDSGAGLVSIFNGGSYENSFFVYDAAHGITAGEKKFWITEGNGIEEYDIYGDLLMNLSGAGTGPGQFKEDSGVGLDEKGDMWVADTGNNRLQEFTPKGEFLQEIAAWNYVNSMYECEYWELEGDASEQECHESYLHERGRSESFNNPRDVSFDNKGKMFVTDTGNSRIVEMESAVPAVEPPPPAPVSTSNAVSTVEYDVPVSEGERLPNLTPGEVEKWGQKDRPVEATAVFPPDEPQGWPAAYYTKATIYYRDSTDRTVNVASPSGGVSTSEYNEHNDVTRSLSADNRASALKEGCETKEKCKSAEVARRLDTQSEYDSEGEELLSTLGPQHMVKLTDGKEVLARSHTIYSYDEGVPAEGGPYRLVTKTTQGAQVEGEPEQDIRTTLTSYSGQEGLGWILRRPTSVTTDPQGLKLTRTTIYDPATGDVIETRTPGAGSASEESSRVRFKLAFGSAGTGDGQFKGPSYIAFEPKSAEVLVSDTGNDRIQRFSMTGTYLSQFGEAGTADGQFKEPTGLGFEPGWGVLYVADSANNRTQFFEGSAYTGSESGYNHPSGMAIGIGEEQYIADTGNNRIIEELTLGGILRSYGSAGAGEGQFKEPRDVAVDSNGDIWVADTANNRVQELSRSGAFLRQFGTLGTGDGQLAKPEGIAIDGKGDVWVADTGNDRIEEFSSTGAFMLKAGEAGTGSLQFKEPKGITIDQEGDLYVADTANNRIEVLTVKELHAGSGTGGVHGTQTLYYTPGSEASVATCRNHPEWANLPCQTQPAEQPNTPGIPNLPVNTLTYNMYGQPTHTESTVTECIKVPAGTGKYTNAGCTTSGSGEYETKASTRSGTITYDEAGRPLATELTSSTGEQLPAVTDKYSETTGALIEQASGGKSLKSTFNTLGQLTSYTDADANTTTYEYEGEGAYQGEKEYDGRLRHADDGKGTQTYTYNQTTGTIQKLADSAAGTFTAGYDVEGNLTSEGYPNAMSANITLNPAGQATSIKYVKYTVCAKTCPETWYTDTVIPSIHGQWMTQQSNQKAQAYTYDQAGRLTQTLDNVSGKGCITRTYTYDEETNRLSLTTRPPNTEGGCANEGGTTETHTYDPANRLTDPGTTYDPFGNTTTLPPTDAGGSELTSTYYQNNRLASQTQNGQTIGYQLDPALRPREIISTGKITATEIQHYPSPASTTPSWTSEISTNYTRYITGVSGTLTAIQHNNETPALQLPNLHGDIIATATDNQTTTSLASTISEASDYGVPATEAPPKYTWLGAHQIPTTLPSGAMAMGARTYIPQLGRFLQTDPQPGGSANAYAYTYGDPVNTQDPSGEYTATFDEFDENYVGGRATAAAAAREQEVREEAERKAAEAAAQAGLYAAIETESPEEWGEEEWWEEEENEEYGPEYAAFGPGPGNHHDEGRLEEGLFVRPEGTESNDDSGVPHTLMVVGGCPSTKDPCYKNVQHSHYKPSKGYACRSGGPVVHGRCQPGRAQPTHGNICRTFAGATAGLAAVSGPGGVILWIAGTGMCYVTK